MKTFKQLLEGVIQPNGTDKIKAEALKDTCWKGYTAIGTKKKNGKTVPNCVPEEVEVNEENGNYSVTIHHTYPDGKKEQFNYKVGAAKSAKHAKNIAMQKHGQKKLPMHSYGASSGDVKKLDEGKMAQLHADIKDHLGKHVANYKKMGGAEHLGNKTVEVAKKIAKLHNISHEAAQKHVNDYVDQNLKESDASWAAAMEKQKENRLTNKDKGTLGKIRDLMDKEKAKREFDLKMKKAQNSQRVAKALGEETINEAHVVHVSDGSKYDEEPHEQDVKHVNDGVKKHGGTFDGHSDKGAFFKFKSHSDAENFKRHVNACPKRTCSADHLDESVNEAVDKEHPIYKEYQSLKKQPLKDLKDQIKRQHRVIDTSEFRSKEHAASHILHNKHGAHRMKAVFGEETELDEKYDHGPIDREAAVKIGHHAAVVAGSGVDSGKHGKVIGQSKTHIGDQWHIKTADGEVVKMYKNRVAKLKEEAELNEAYRLPSDSEIDKVKAHVKANHPNKSLAQVAVHKQSKKIEYVVKDKEGKMTGHTLGEEVEQIDEISKQTLGNYIKRSSHDAALSARHGGSDPKELKNAIKRLKGIAKATNKLTKEESEQIDEISKDTLHSYIHKAFAQGNDLHYDLAHSRGNKATDAERKALQAKISKRNTGIIKAGKKLREDVSMLSFEDFLKEQKACKKEELHPNQKKLDVNKNGKLDSDDFVKLRAGKKKEVDEKYVSDAQRKAVWASKNEKGVKEEVELDEAMTPMQKLKDALDRHSEKAVAANKAGDHEAVKVHQGYMNKIKTKMGKLAKNEEIDLNEMEELCEISKQTLASYIPQAAKSARFYGMTSQDMKNRSDRARNQGMKDSFARLSSKYRNKAWKREDNIEKAAQKLAREEVEQIDELSKKTLGSYAKSAAAQTLGLSAALGAMKTVDSAVDAQRKLRNRYQGTQKAITKLAKEEKLDELSKKTLQSYQSKIGHDLDRAMDAMPHGTGDDKEDRKLNNRMVGDERAQKRLMKMNKEETEVITFKDLMQNISEAAIDDLKDRIAARKATQSAYDKDYKPAAKTNVQKVKGHSYGAGEEEGEDDDDTKKVSKPAAPEVKRGRGRPAGSKSGARR